MAYGELGNLPTGTTTPITDYLKKSLVVNSVEDIPDGLIGADFNWYTSDYYKTLVPYLQTTKPQEVVIKPTKTSVATTPAVTPAASTPAPAQTPVQKALGQPAVTPTGATPTGTTVGTAGMMPTPSPGTSPTSILSAIGQGAQQVAGAMTSAVRPAMAGPDVLSTATSQGGPAQAPKGLSPGQVGAIAGAQYASQAIGDIAATKQYYSQQDYLGDVNYWKEQQKMWFDQDSDVAPTFEEYLGNMPSSKEALVEGSLTGLPRTEKVVGGAFSGAATGAGVGAAIGSAGGPAGAAAGAGIGAIIGAGVGTLVGAIEAVMSWDAAENLDAKNRERSYNEYKAKLKQWTYAKNKRNQLTKAAFDAKMREERINLKKEAIAAKELKKISQNNTAIQNRNAMVASINDIGKYAAMKKAERMGRWAPNKSYNLADLFAKA